MIKPHRHKVMSGAPMEATDVSLCQVTRCRAVTHKLRLHSLKIKFIETLQCISLQNVQS